MSWESLEIKTAKLSFINSDEELKNLLQNTILFSYLTKQYEPIPLLDFLESTQYGYTASSSDVGTHLFVRITDIQEGRVNWESVPFCNCERPVNYLLAPNDFLIARTGGTTGKSFLVQSPPDNVVFASYLIRMRFKDKVNVKFIQFFLNSYLFWSQILELKSGTAQPNVNAEKLKTLLIPACPFEVQNQIVEAYEAFGANGDNTIVSSLLNKSSQLFEHLKGIESELTHQQTLLTRLHQSILQEAVQGQLTAQWRQANSNQAPASELLRRIQAEKAAKGKKEKPLPPVKAEEMPFELPKGWMWCRLGEIAIEVSTGPFGTMLHKADYIEGGIPLINPMNMVNGKIIPTSSMTVSEKTKERLSSYALKTDDIVIARRGEMGRCVVVTEKENGWLCGTGSFFLQLSLQLNKEYFFRVFGSEYSKNYLGSESVGSTMSNLNHRILNNLPFPLPPLPEQQAIVAQVERLLGLVGQLEAEAAGQRVLAEGLLQAALREAMGHEVSESRIGRINANGQSSCRAGHFHS